MKRRKAREYTVQLLYMLDTAGMDSINPADAPKLVDLYTKHFIPQPQDTLPDHQFWLALVAFALERMPEIDTLIESQSDHWKLQRMTRVDRSVLRMAAAELMSFAEIDPSVTMNEALEVAKRFGNEESAPFVNGVLDNLWKKISSTTPKSNP